jgi:hypothetical protein
VSGEEPEVDQQRGQCCQESDSQVVDFQLHGDRVLWNAVQASIRDSTSRTLQAFGRASPARFLNLTPVRWPVACSTPGSILVEEYRSKVYITSLLRVRVVGARVSTLDSETSVIADDVTSL